MSQAGGGGNEPRQRHRRRRDRRHSKSPSRVELTSPRWSKESGPKVCLKCGGRMYPADWIWQQYGLCLGWRCSQCKEKVLARSLPFKGLRKRKPDPDEVRDRVEAKGQDAEPTPQPHVSAVKQGHVAGRRRPERDRREVTHRE
jgi:hypothetical protein